MEVNELVKKGTAVEKITTKSMPYEAFKDNEYIEKLLDRGKEHKRGNDHQHRGDDERQLDDPEIALMVGGVDVIAQHEEEAEHRGERTADVAHDVDDAVGLRAQGLGRDVRHESDGGVLDKLL